MILLSYSANHLARKENQKDFQERMKQFFDHYLKGTAPKWMIGRRAADSEGRAYSE